ncbi:MAG: hypothetical protein ACRYGG_00975 [Janthinobacterium lividum]
MKRMIWVTFQKEGFHKYPDAPDEVSYLRNEHRHIFHFKVSIEVCHNEREIEFHMFRTWLLNLFNPNQLNANNKSCETLAAEILYSIKGHVVYGGPFHGNFDLAPRYVEVTVSEDDECGATLSNR